MNDYSLVNLQRDQLGLGNFTTYEADFSSKEYVVKKWNIFTKTFELIESKEQKESFANYNNSRLIINPRMRHYLGKQGKQYWVINEQSVGTSKITIKETGYLKLERFYSNPVINSDIFCNNLIAIKQDNEKKIEIINFLNEEIIFTIDVSEFDNKIKEISVSDDGRYMAIVLNDNSIKILEKKLYWDNQI